MPRFLVAVALLTLATAGQAQGPGVAPPSPPRMRAAGVPTNVGTCSGCSREIQWTGGSAGAPRKCPHCGVSFNYVENDDGTRSRIPGTSGGYDSGSSFHSFRGAGRLIGLAVFVVVFVVSVLIKLVGMLFSSGSSRPKRRKAKKRRPVEEDDDEPTPRRARPQTDGKAIPMATLADDPGYEVIGDAPAPSAEPPRRAKARLIPPGGAP